MYKISLPCNVLYSFRSLPLAFGNVTTADKVFKVRLADGTDDMEGRVEVHYNGSWATVCDDKWDIMDATVVCRMLGYPLASEALRGAAFGRGRGSIILDKVTCHGNEKSIAVCRHRGLFKHGCNHDQDAGVRCLSKCLIY